LVPSLTLFGHPPSILDKFKVTSRRIFDATLQSQVTAWTRTTNWLVRPLCPSGSRLESFVGCSQLFSPPSASLFQLVVEAVPLTNDGLSGRLGVSGKNLPPSSFPQVWYEASLSSAVFSGLLFRLVCLSATSLASTALSRTPLFLAPSFRRRLSFY